MDPVNGDVWMGLHNTLLHFDKEGIRRSEYQIYTPEGTRLEATVILVEEERLLIGADPLGVYEFRAAGPKTLENFRSFPQACLHNSVHAAHAFR